MAWRNPFNRGIEKPCAPAPIQPQQVPARTTRSAKITLASIVGAGVALALGVALPKEESGRVVEASLGAENQLVLTHVRGKQYQKAYLDIAGVPTICDGLTKIRDRRVKITDHLTEEECSELFEEEAVIHSKGVMRCSPGLALSPVPATETRREGPRFAAVMLAFNVGISGYCSSTAARRFNAFDYPGGCEALTRWDKARVNGVLRPVRGLINRRERERRVCVGGLAVFKDVF